VPFVMPSIVGVPIKLLHECCGHIVSIELTSATTLRGRLADAEDNMNCHLTNVTVTSPSGQSSHSESTFIRGSQIRLIVLPDMLRHAAMFDRFNAKSILEL